MKKIIIYSFLLILLVQFYSFTADISVPNIEMYSIGNYDENDNKFKIRTISDFDVKIQGGFKFKANILLGYENQNMEGSQTATPNYDDDINTDDSRVQDAANQAILFKGANITILDFAGTPLELTYFTGEFDTFLTGDIFYEEFGSIPVGTRYRGYKYFPGEEESQFEGLYQANGTGLAISTANISDKFRSTLYTYQDNNLGQGYFSSDWSNIINFEQFKSEIFAGVSYPDNGEDIDDPLTELGGMGTYRGGFLLFLDTGTGGELLAQIGVPRWNPEAGSLDLDSFYYLLEARLRAGLFSFIFTHFKHPKYYLHEEINEESQKDFNFNLMIGDVYKTKFSGGFEVTLKQNEEAGEDEERLIIYGSPYLTTVTSGIIWDFKVRVRGFPQDEGVTTMFEGIIGIKAEF